MALISIILPVHNGATTIGQAVDSCLQQTHEDLELILVDDASTDDTAAILDRRAAGDERIRLAHGERNLGVAAAFQLGLSLARGHWIARMDADDLNHPQRLEKQLSLLSAHLDLDAVSCLVEIAKRKPDGALGPADEGYQRFAQWLNTLTTPSAITAQRFVDQPVVNPSMLLRREVFDRHEGFRSGLDWAEDYDFWLRLLHEGGQIAKVPEILFTWTDHEGRLTRRDPVYTQDAFLRCKAYYLARIPQVAERGVVLAGAGPIGKTMARAIGTEKIHLHHFFEVHPRRIGERIHGVPVIPVDSWGPCRPGSPIVLGCVGQPGKRRHLLELARERGHTEGEDFFAVA